MKTRILSATVLFSALVLAGCANRAYVAGPPPPPYAGPHALIEMATQNGHRDGFDDGRRDAYERRGFRPNHDAKFKRTPGYDPNVGPFGPYQQYYRDAYMRGYREGFSGR